MASPPDTTLGPYKDSVSIALHTHQPTHSHGQEKDPETRRETPTQGPQGPEIHQGRLRSPVQSDVQPKPSSQPQPRLLIRGRGPDHSHPPLTATPTHPAQLLVAG